jgi:hypothetical protein
VLGCIQCIVDVVVLERIHCVACGVLGCVHCDVGVGMCVVFIDID